MFTDAPELAMGGFSVHYMYLTEVAVRYFSEEQL